MPHTRACKHSGWDFVEKPTPGQCECSSKLSSRSRSRPQLWDLATSAWKLLIRLKQRCCSACCTRLVPHHRSHSRVLAMPFMATSSQQMPTRVGKPLLR